MSWQLKSSCISMSVQKNSSKCVTINLFLWVSSSVQIWKPPSPFGFFSLFFAVFFGSCGWTSSLLWDSFSDFSPVSTLTTKHSRVIVLFLHFINNKVKIWRIRLWLLQMHNPLNLPCVCLVPFFHNLNREILFYVTLQNYYKCTVRYYTGSNVESTIF